MKPSLVAATLTCLLSLCVCWEHGMAATARQVRGIVLSVIPDTRDVVIRHDAYGGMPSMAMRFRLATGVHAQRLHAGDRIAAAVEDGANGSTLTNVRVIAAAPRDSTPVLRNVKALQIGDRIPAAGFVDQDGRRFTFADLAGKNVVLAFIYTRCRDPRMCPLISSNFHTLQRSIDPRTTHLVEVTLDPTFDTPRVLRAYGRAFDADRKRWTFATGAADTVLNFAAQFGIEPFPDPRVGLIHTERTVLIDRTGHIVDFIEEASWSSDGVLARLHAMDSRPSNPLARLDYELSKMAVAVCGNGVAGFSGLADLAIVLAIIGGAAWLMFRLAGRIFREQI